MFKKVLIANRGEIAARIIRTCREMGIVTTAVYEAADQGSLHVRLADECIEIESADIFMDEQALVEIAVAQGADAIHPGYGFISEEADFAHACTDAGITLIAPPAKVTEKVRGKLAALEAVRAAGIDTVDHSPISFGPDETDALQTAAHQLDYPLVIKSCSGGRGPGERLVQNPKQLGRAIRRAQMEAKVVYGNQRVYLERAILPARQIGVQILGDQHGNIVHLGEREGSLQVGNRKVIEEGPAPNLTPEQREELQQTALEIAHLFEYQNAGTVEFLMGEDGRFYFSEVKSRIQVEHSLTEMLTRIDLVREQFLIAAGEPLSFTQEEIQVNGWAMLCRIKAEDPLNRLLPTPGELKEVRLPSGPEVRIDTYAYCHCNVPPQYDPLIAKLTVWGPDRETCLKRARRALEDFVVSGTPTNIPMLQQVISTPEFIDGRYTVGLPDALEETPEQPEKRLQDMAAIAAILFMRRNRVFTPTVPNRVLKGWHRNSRRLPQ